MTLPEDSGFIHKSACIDEGCHIGQGTRIWHFSHIMTGARIGDNCILGQNVMVGSGVKLGNNVKVQNNVSIYEGVICENDVFLGPSMVFTNVINPRSAVPRKDQFRSTLVKRGASIGANATVICGHTIGEFAFIGAGSVVTRNIKNFELVAGNPARRLGWVSEYGHKLIFDISGIAICPETKQQYRLLNDEVNKL